MVVSNPAQKKLTVRPTLAVKTVQTIRKGARAADEPVAAPEAETQSLADVYIDVNLGLGNEEARASRAEEPVEIPISEQARAALKEIVEVH